MTADDDSEVTIEALSDLRAGDDESIYDNVDVESLPTWWQRAIKEHEEYGLRPYRPPRFADGAMLPQTLECIEDQQGVVVRLQGKNVSVGDPWTVVINGNEKFEVPRRRDPDGFTVIEVSKQDFIDSVESHTGAEEDSAGKSTSDEDTQHQ